jgi:hypothetical protein
MLRAAGNYPVEGEGPERCELLQGGLQQRLRERAGAFQFHRWRGWPRGRAREELPEQRLCHGLYLRVNRLRTKHERRHRRPRTGGRRSYHALLTTFCFGLVAIDQDPRL